MWKNTFSLDLDDRAITVVHGFMHNGKFAVILDIFLLYVSVIHEKDNHMLRMWTITRFSPFRH